MLPLTGETLPTTANQLAAALERGFQLHGLNPRKVTVAGDYPKLTELTVDLTNGQVSRWSRPAPATLRGAGDSVEVAHFALFGEPIYFEKVPAEIRLEAEDARLRISGEPVTASLVPESATAGTVSVKIAREALEALLLSIVSQLAAKQGVEVKNVKLDLTQEGARRVSFRAEVAAKVFIMNASLALTGRLDVDDAFNAKISGLDLDGDSMVVNLAGSFLRPRLQELEGRTFPLLAFSPGGLKLRDLQLSVSPALHLQAKFGSEA